MLNVLKQLQNEMTSKDDQIRAQATHQFRIKLELMEVSENEAEFLFEFFIHKLNDSQSILDSTWILLNLSKQTKQLNTLLLSQINKKALSIPQLQREARINIYQILFSYPINHELASAIILSITGEKDPRNILVAFKLCKMILENQEIAKQYKKDLFEYLDCYYPIEFDERADKRYIYDYKRFSIKSSEIEEILNECLFSEILLNESILLLQDKIVSAYDKAQGSALKSVNWLLNNQKALTSAQVDEIYDSIQKLTDQIIMDDEVIIQIPYTLLEILKQERFQKIGNKIIKIALKTVEEIPATQQGYIYFNFIKLLIKDKHLQVFQNIIQIFVKKFDTSNVNIAQKRLETIITSISEYKKYEMPFIQELLNTEKEKLLKILFESLKHTLMNIFVLALKSLIEIMEFYPEQQRELENLLFDQLPSRNQVEQQCILDYFCKFKIRDIDRYQQLLEFWKGNNLPLFDYSNSCSFKNIPDYFSSFILQNTLSQSSILKQQHINQIKQYLEDETNDKQYIMNQVQLIMNGIFQENVEIKQKSKGMKQILHLIIEKFNPTNEFLDQLEYYQLLKLSENQLYYYIVILNKNRSERLVPKMLTEIFEQDFVNIKFKNSSGKQIYKLIFHCLYFFTGTLYVDFPEICQLKNNWNSNNLNQLQLVLVILRHDLLLNNNKILNKILEISQQEPELIKQIIKEKDYKSSNQFQFSLIQQIINSTKNNSLINYLLNLLDEEQILQFKDERNLQIIIEQFNDNKIDKLKAIQQIVSLCQAMKLPILQYLVQVETTNIQVLYTLINVIMNNYEEAKYNLNLYQKGISFMKKYLNYQKRVVRQAAQEAINEWCIVFSKGL